MTLRSASAAGGICGSDLHYYHHGGFGTVRIKQPMILGHEIAGTVDRNRRRRQRRPESGDKVAVNPSLPCGTCRYCLDGRPNQCLDMRFYGSAMRMPACAGRLPRGAGLCPSRRPSSCPTASSLSEAACAEPLSVCLHAARQAGSAPGQARAGHRHRPDRRAGSIMVARQAGAREVVATDLLDAPLALARKIGADRTVNARREPAALDAYTADKGYFDVAVRSLRRRPALRAAHRCRCVPARTIVQLGLGGEMTRADEPPARQGNRAARHVPLPRGIRLGGRLHRHRAASTSARCSPRWCHSPKRSARSISRPIADARDEGAASF